MNSELLIKAAVWIVPVIFGAGGVYANLSTSKAAVAKIEKKIEKIESAVSEHEKVPQHPVGARELKGVKRAQREMLAEQKAIRRDQVRVFENISAICQATNARCK